MSEQLDRFSLILGPGEKIEEPEAPKPKKRRGRPKKTKGRSTKGKSKKTRPTGKVPSGRRRYEIRNLSTMDVVLRFSGAPPTIIRKSETLCADLLPGDLQNNSVQQMVLNANLSIKELSPPAEGSVVYLQPDGSCTTEVPKGKNDTVVRFGYIVPSTAGQSDSAQFVTMQMDVDGFDTDVMTDGVVRDGDVMVMLRGGEMEMYRDNGLRMEYSTFAGIPYGAASRELEYEEEEPEQNEVDSMLDFFDEY